jgi:mRNA turnover protein 4
MPVSKRNRTTALTKVKSKPKSAKSSLITEIRDLLPTFKYTYVIEICNDRNSLLKGVRDAIRPGRIFLGKNKVMQLALGLDRSSELLPNLSALSPLISGSRGILLSNLPSSSLDAVLAELSTSEFARTGCSSLSDVSLEAGTDAFAVFPHSIEAHLRKLGLPTALENGRIRLLQNFDLCKEGETLSSDQVQILKLLGIPMATFEVKVVASHDNQA